MFAKLSPRNGFLLALMACLVALILWYFLFFQAQLLNITQQQQTLEGAQSQVATLRSDSAQLPALRKTVADLKTTSDNFYAALPRFTEIGNVVDTLRLNVSGAGGTLGSLNIGSGSAQNLPAGVRAVALSMAVSARFQQTYQILRSLETMTRFSTVSALSLALPAANSTDPLLSSSMVANIYTFDPDAAPGPGGSRGTPGTPAIPATPGTPAAPGAAAVPATPGTPAAPNAPVPSGGTK